MKSSLPVALAYFSLKQAYNLGPKNYGLQPFWDYEIWVRATSRKEAIQRALGKSVSFKPDGNSRNRDKPKDKTYKVISVNFIRKNSNGKQLLDIKFLSMWNSLAYWERYSIQNQCWLEAPRRNTKFMRPVKNSF